jgi:hypothetical protein
VRTVYPVVPSHVEYALTPLGRTLLGPLKALCEWAQEHMDDVHAARAGVRSKRAAAERLSTASSSARRIIFVACRHASFMNVRSSA